MKTLFNYFYLCSKHKQYQAKRKPKVLCEQCWTAWVMKKYEEPLRPIKVQDMNADQ